MHDNATANPSASASATSPAASSGSSGASVFFGSPSPRLNGSADHADELRTPYLSLDPEIEESIRADIEANRKNPYAFRDEEAVRRTGKEHDEATLARTAFGRDIEKILNVPAYNRYADKTQVFSLVENDEICRRGLHVQLVSRIARNIGRLLGLNTELIEAIALGHDTGHTPFGHAGERFLSSIYHARTGRYFNHNVHSVRVLDTLYPRNISLQTLDGILCHNGEFCCQTLTKGSTSSFEDLDALIEACNRDESTISSLRPSTLEGCVVRVSDMIAYIGKDRSDALDIGVLPDLDCFDTRILGRDNATIVNNLTVDIVNNSYGKDTISLSPEMFEDLKLAKRQNYEVIYMKEGLVQDAGNVVDEMFSATYERLLDDLLSDHRESPVFRHHIRRLVSKSRSFTAEDYLANTDPNLIVVDYIASMTDSYFLSLYDHLFPDSETSLALKSYF